MGFDTELPVEIAMLDSAWKQYLSSNEAMLAQQLGAVVSWRWASGGMFPEHPLFGQADTTARAEPWREFDRQWIVEDDPKTETIFASQHGFDASKRFLFQQKKHFGCVYVHHDTYSDEFRFDKAEDGKLAKRDDDDRMRRFFYDDQGRIECVARFSDEYGTKYYEVERFVYQGDVCAESFLQWYEIMPELPEYKSDASEEELRADYRPLQGKELINNLVEIMYMRKHIKYSYDAGQLVQAEVIRHDGKPAEELLFERKPQRALEKVIDDLAARTATTIFKAAKKRAPGKPYRALVLIYSAEHAHCGLPHAVNVVSSEQSLPDEVMEWEAYENELDVSFKRPVLSCLSEFNQRCYSQFGIESMDEEAEAATEVMRKIATHLVDDLKGTKHVSDDFRVIYIDDHGDVAGGQVN